MLPSALMAWPHERGARQPGERVGRLGERFEPPCGAPYVSGPARGPPYRSHSRQVRSALDDRNLTREQPGATTLHIAPRRQHGHDRPVQVRRLLGTPRVTAGDGAPPTGRALPRRGRGPDRYAGERPIGRAAAKRDWRRGDAMKIPPPRRYDVEVPVQNGGYSGDAMKIPPPRRYDPYNPHPPSATSTLDCPCCRSIQPVFDDPVQGPRCARCGSPAPVGFDGEPASPVAD
jgi:hypothetical protein